MKQRTVILRRCETYDVNRIAGIIREGKADLGEKPHGRVLIKPNT